MKTMVIDVANRKAIISPNIYGHFSEHLGRCIYEGIYVGENSTIPNKNGMRTDVVAALKELKVPVLRWPGGCFADEYHWKDGIGEKSSRKRMINTHWGGVVEDNSFGTHEFFELCEQLGCEPYIAGNLGSGTVQELSEWIEYMTFGGVSPMAELRRRNGREEPWKLKYLGIGNESWGCGGNMRPQYYADLYRQYQTYCRDYGDNHLYKVACGPNSDDYNWTDELLQIVKPWHTKAISLHYYTLPTGNWDKKGSATEFDDNEYYATISKTLFMNELIEKHTEIMSRHDPKHEIGLIVDEWGTWYDVEKGTNPGFLYQQNTMRDALVAAINLNIFNSHADRVVMANIAQMLNVLQAVILTEGERMIRTPTYYVFEMYKPHMGAQLVYSACEQSFEENIPTISHSASTKDGKLFVTLSNASLSSDEEIKISLPNFSAGEIVGRIITDEVHAHNTFDGGETVKSREFSAFELANGEIKVKLPSCSVVSLEIK